MKKRPLLFVAVLLVGIGITLFLAYPVSQIKPLGLSTHRNSFGSTGLGSVGWRFSPNTLISTSHTTTESLSGFIEATVNVFPYGIKPGTTLFLSLYVNGQFAATRTYNLTGVYTHPASVVGFVRTDVANFTDSMLGFTVSQLPLSSSLPQGGTVTVLAWASDPIWVQLDGSSQTHSYETRGVTSFSAPIEVTPDTGTIASHALSVEVESSGQ